MGWSILIKFLVKNCFWRRNLSFQILLEHQIIKISVLTIWRRRGLKIQNYSVHFCDCCVPGGFFELTNKSSSISAPRNIFSSSIPIFIAFQTTTFVSIFGFYTILIFVLWTIWPRQSIDLDLSCSEHFFRLPGGSYSVPNGLISIFPFSPFFRFWHFSWFSLNFNFFQSILCHFSIFFHKILPEPPL